MFTWPFCSAFGDTAGRHRDDDDHGKINSNFTSRSTSILCPGRPQFHVQIDFNFTSRSTSISCPDRPQSYVQIDFNFTSVAKPCRRRAGIIDLLINWSTSVLSVRPSVHLSVRPSVRRRRRDFGELVSLLAIPQGFSF